MNHQQFIKKTIDAMSEEINQMNDDIWDMAEIRYREKKSASLQIKRLSEEGFRVKSRLADIPTAFVASWGEGKPVIGILGEFDALEDMSQEPDTFSPKKRKGTSSGHGCGHNALGTAGLYAAVAVCRYMKKYSIKGTVRYYGCPAEEGGSGKTFMTRAGCFSDLDIALTWHPNYCTSMIKSGSLANVRCVYRFHGISSHAAASPQLGRNALSAVELMNIGVNYFREHLIPEARIHYAVTNSGGDASNIIQKEAEVVYAIRAPKVYQIEEIRGRIEKIAQGAALMTDTKLESRIISGYSDYISNPVVEQIVQRILNENHTCGHTEEEFEYAERYTGTIECDNTAIIWKENCICNNVSEPMPMLGSTDVGDVSWNVPTAQFYMTGYAKGTCLHSWQATAQGKSSIMHKAASAAAKVIALSAAEFFENPYLAEKAKREHIRQFDGQKYICPVPEEILPDIKNDDEVE